MYFINNGGVLYEGSKDKFACMLRNFVSFYSYNKCFWVPKSLYKVFFNFFGLNKVSVLIRIEHKTKIEDYL